MELNLDSFANLSAFVHPSGVTDSGISADILLCNLLSSVTAHKPHTSLADLPVMQYSNDVEMWEFDDRLASPLASLTADFARFKKRFAQLFEGETHRDEAPSMTGQRVSRRPPPTCIV